MEKLDTWCLFVSTILLLSGFAVVQACLSLEEYAVTCTEPFLTWEQQGAVHEELCGNPDGNGIEVFHCILNNKDCYPTDLNFIFEGLFKGNGYNISIICEIHFHPDCQSQQGCFTDSVSFDSTNNTVLGYYNFFCRPDTYLQKGYSCLDLENCTYSSDRAMTTINFLAKDNRVITLRDLNNPLKTTCGQLTDTDRSCITGNTENIANCRITPLIRTFVNDSTLQCRATDRTRACLTELCSLTVANFYLDMFGLFPCTEWFACDRSTENNIDWPITLLGETVYAACYSDIYEGNISRTCSPQGTWEDVVDGCVLPDGTKSQILGELDSCLNRDNCSLDEQSSLLDKVNQVVKQDKDLDSGTVQKSLRLQDSVLTLIEQTGNSDEQVLDTLVKSMDSLLDPSLSGTLTEINTDEASPVKPSLILDMTNRYIKVQDKVCEEPAGTQHVASENFMYVAVTKVEGEVIFPSLQTQTDTTTIDLRSADITISAAALENMGLGGKLCIGGSYFTTLGQSLEPQKKEDDETNQDFQIESVVNSDIVSLSFNVQGTSFDQLDPPAKIKIKPKFNGYENPQCVFWDFAPSPSVEGSSQGGAWSKTGCTLVSYDDIHIECLCDHLTNFAVLMSPKPSALAKALNIISAVGCGISIFCILLTIICHMVVWRLVRSDRATILMNLCVALLLALVTFMVGINRVESRVACAAIAAVIQFLFLAVFFLMFLMGIEILICVVHVFGTKFRIKVLLPLTWFAAALVVGISLWLTKAKGYGSDKFCWLDTESGLIWAFIGPAAFVIFANFIIMAVVFQKMATSAVLKSKSAKEKATMTAKSLCVLLPLIGVTWVFGLLTVNEDTEFFAYIFCAVNSLQGLFIFLFHCVFNRQIRDAWRQRQARKRSLQSLSSDFRNRSAINSLENPNTEKKRKNSNQSFVSNPLEVKSNKKKVLNKEDDWERAERKKYHKNVRRGNIYQ